MAILWVKSLTVVQGSQKQTLWQVWNVLEALLERELVKMRSSPIHPISHQEVNTMIAKANPNEYLVIGHNGKVTNRGTGIQVFLWPGSTYILLPSTKQAAMFEMTQETKDGIPLHFKGIVIYRITRPEQTAVNFNFNDGSGVEEISTIIRSICLGELRAVVSSMTMTECIEQRKTVLTAAVDAALRQVVQAGEGEETFGWGIELEMVQVAQVYIIDDELRAQLEAEVRNSIRAKSNQSDIHTQEETRLAQLGSERRIQEQKLVAEKDAIRQKEEIELANTQYRRRAQKENQEVARETIQLATEKFKLEQEAGREKAETETPVRLLQLEKQRSILERELEIIQVETQVRELEVRRDLLAEQAHQALRKEIMPLEQTPVLAQALANVFQGANLSFFGSESQVLASIIPLVEILSRAVQKGLPPDLKTAVEGNDDR
jgi:hypothetical protein